MTSAPRVWGWERRTTPSPCWTEAVVLTVERSPKLEVARRLVSLVAGRLAPDHPV